MKVLLARHPSYNKETHKYHCTKYMPIPNLSTSITEMLILRYLFSPAISCCTLSLSCSEALLFVTKVITTGTV